MRLPVELQANENVVLRVRKHRLFFYLPLLPIILITAIITVGLLFLGPIGVLIAAVIWLLVLIYIYYRWYQYIHDEWIITNQRLIDSYKKNWFHQSLSSADLVNVQDMQVQKNGLFATIFNFGDLRCETAGSQQHFILGKIPNPAKVLDIIDEARDIARRSVSQPTN